MAWSDDRVALLKRLWADGLTAAQIAKELGGFPECTDGGRSAVIGKVHRLGLSDRRRPANNSPLNRTLKRKRSVRLAFITTSSPDQQKPKPLPIEDMSIIPIEQRRTLLQLTEETCRWPIGDPQSPDFFFCGGGPIEGLPYCPYHCRAAYEPVTARRPYFRTG